ncbi:MAG: Nif3-like dinuclear metal center hexameric protein [Candidatus Thermoplasmatota archaeon]|nr:Nif3-like dinuclear metal center hexameric protein [Candidatus Thermoplasmatota archaeon]
MTITEFISLMEKHLPVSIQESFDNSGIQIGPFEKPLKNPILSLDLSLEVVNKAIEINSTMIITHHPFFFTPFKKLLGNNIRTEIIKKLLNNSITVYAIHTPIDKIEGGMNDYFCKLIGLINIEGFVKSGINEIYKVQVFVPDTHKDLIVNTIAEEGGGWIGNYSDCTFSTSGIGTFKPHENTNPYIGTKDKREYVNETKIETVIPKVKLDHLIREVQRVHPYEEVAMEAFPLTRPHFAYHLCRKGTLKYRLQLLDFINHLKKITQQQSIRFNGDLTRLVKKIGVCTGSGTSFLENAAQEQLDVFITGDVGYHDFQFADEHGFSIVEITHNHTEQYFPTVFTELFKDYDIHYHQHFSSFLNEC